MIKSLRSECVRVCVCANLSTDNLSRTCSSPSFSPEMALLHELNGLCSFFQPNISSKNVVATNSDEHETGYFQFDNKTLEDWLVHGA